MPASTFFREKRLPSEALRLLRIAVPPPPRRNARRRRRHAAPEALLAAIAVVRGRRLAVVLAQGALVVVLALAGMLAVEMLFDWLINFPWLGRLGLFLAGATVTAALVWRFLVLPAWQRPDDDSVALMIEHAMPVFESRFIAALQLAGEHGAGAKAPMLVRALVSETVSMVRSLSFRLVVKTERLRRLTLIALGAAVVGGVVFWLCAPSSGVLLRRAFLSTEPVPRKTQILNATGSRKIGVGSDLVIEADAGGVVPAGGRVRLTMDSGKVHAFTLEPDPERPAHFSRKIASVQEGFTYVIELNDARSEEYRIDIALPPVVAEIKLRQEFPAYTGLPPVERQASDLSLLAGSRLTVEARATAPLAQARLRLAGLEETVKMEVARDESKRALGAFRIPAEKLSGFSIALVDEAGVASRDEPLYCVDILPDKPPEIAVLLPERREMLVTRLGTLVIAFRAEDDYGVARMRLHYAVNPKSENPPPAKVLEFDLGGTERRIARRFQWKIASAQPAPVEGDVIEYWIEAVDNNDVTGPGSARTETAEIKVVTEAEKRVDLANRLNDTVSGLDEVTRAQSELVEDVGELIFARPE